MQQMSETKHNSSPPTPPAARLVPQAESFWSLRFKDAELESRFLVQMLERDRVLAHSIAIITMVAAVLMHFADYYSLPSHVASGALNLRLPAFLACWGLFLYAIDRHKTTPGLPWLVFISGLLCISCFMFSLCVSWENGVFRHYQPMLAIPLFAALAGCLPWRMGVPYTILATAMIMLPEWFYQPDIGQRNLHTGFLVMAAITGIFGGFVIERHSRQHFLTNNRYLEQSRHDALTGLPNRRALDVLLPQLLRQHAQDGSRIALALFDVDYFKAYNDHYGHSAGDAVLINIASAISHQARPRPDFVARYGGEEFVAIWRQAPEQPLPLGEGLRQAVARLALPHVISPQGQISISAGITTLMPTPTTHAKDVLSAADHALYRAKASGRDRVETSAAFGRGREAAAGTGAPPLAPRLRTEEAARFADDASQLSQAERQRFARERGLYERHQLFSTGILCLLLNLATALISYLNLTPQAATTFVSLILGIIVPSLIISICLARQDWALKISRHLLPFVILIPGLCYSYAFYYALSRGWYVPYELILINLYQIYIAGGQSWRAAALASWVLSLVNIGIYLYYNPYDSLTGTVTAFLLINAIGALVSRAQDLRVQDSFIKRERLETLALHDSLTGLANRTGMARHLSGLLPALARDGKPLACAMADIDYFKDYNDHYGHVAGDAVLATVARTLQRNAPDADTLAVRYGGEEFLLLWRIQPEDDLARQGERLCTAIRTLNIPHTHSRTGQLTISIGLAQSLAPPADAAAIAQLIEQADRALYRAKEEGRNRVTVWQQKD